ncbi:ionotropic receptor 93a-like [Limulus polyphemus]|uniref:Ionotropic receptor 93a-like n=1 Tax=Limulus polyphemus TaxID=6850 RepID=A0ABM1TF38_LIMPO|nr:ionotropic receptor 93a-like [Limulus polyphemus]
MLIISVIFFLINRVSPFYKLSTDLANNQKYFSYLNCLWLSYGTMVQQGSSIIPKAHSARLVLITWWLSVLIIIATYSGNLIAFLTFPEARWLVRDLKDVIENPNINIMVESGTALVEEIESSNVAQLVSLRNALENRQRAAQSYLNSNVFDLVATGKAVYLDEKNFMSQAMLEDFIREGFCRTSITSKPFLEKELAFSMRRGDRFISKINAA